jgi:hypothetical protein
VEQARPRLDTRASEDAKQLRPQVAVALAVASDDELGADLGLLERVEQHRSQFGEERQASSTFAAASRVTKNVPSHESRPVGTPIRWKIIPFPYVVRERST